MSHLTQVKIIQKHLNSIILTNVTTKKDTLHF